MPLEPQFQVTEPSRSPDAPKTSGTLPGRALVLLAVFALADVAVIAAHVVNELAGVYTVMFNLDEEQNLPTWLSSVQFAAAAGGAALAGAAAAGRVRVGWWTLAAVLLFFSADEASLIHEKLGPHAPNALPGVFDIYLPLAAACVIGVLAVLDDVRGPLRHLLVLGFALLACSAALDGADSQALDQEGFRPLIILEEASELAGTAILAIVGLSSYLLKARPAFRPSHKASRHDRRTSRTRGSLTSSLVPGSNAQPPGGFGARGTSPRIGRCPSGD